MYDNPNIDDFKSFFTRDFPYGTDPATSITDQDIANAFIQTNANINQDLFISQPTYTLGYELLSAHFLVISIQSSSQGISGSFSWQQSSKSVGSISESFAIPQRILDSPEYSWLSKTTYGTRYLMMILPYMTGQMFAVFGSTRP